MIDFEISNLITTAKVLLINIFPTKWFKSNKTNITTINQSTVKFPKPSPHNTQERELFEKHLQAKLNL